MTMDAKAAIQRIAQVAEDVGWQAGVGGCETAGAIVSYLAANPDRIDTFLKDGLLDALDTPGGHARDMHLNGRLTWHSMSGDVVSPEYMRSRREAAMQALADQAQELGMGYEPVGKKA